MEDKSELVAVSRLVDALNLTLAWLITSARLATQAVAEDLAAASTPHKAYSIVHDLVMGSILSGMVALFADSQLEEDDPRLVAVIKETIGELTRYSDDQLRGCVADHTARVMQAAGKLTNGAPMVSVELVDEAARRASDTISTLLNEFVSQTAMRLPSGGVSGNVNLLEDHMRPTIAEIQREIGLFRVEIGSPHVTNEAVNANCAAFWRDWERACGPAGYEPQL